MINCKTFKEFTKINRKYYMKRWRKNRYKWDCWLSYQVTELNQIPEIERSKYYKYSTNLQHILEHYKQHRNEEMYFHGPHEFGTFVGIEITNEDYYYIYNSHGVRKYESCVGRIMTIDKFKEFINNQLHTKG